MRIFLSSGDSSLPLIWQGFTPKDTLSLLCITINSLSVHQPLQTSYLHIYRVLARDKLYLQTISGNAGCQLNFETLPNRHNVEGLYILELNLKFLEKKKKESKVLIINAAINYLKCNC